MKYRISKEAGNDLRKIWRYTVQKWSIEQARRYYKLLMDEIEFISTNPDSGKDFSHVREGYFRSTVKSHFIFYKIDIDREEIEVVRILHQRMDIQSRLSE